MPLPKPPKLFRIRRDTEESSAAVTEPVSSTIPPQPEPQAWSPSEPPPVVEPSEPVEATTEIEPAPEAETKPEESEPTSVAPAETAPVTETAPTDVVQESSPVQSPEETHAVETPVQEEQPTESTVQPTSAAPEDLSRYARPVSREEAQPAEPASETPKTDEATEKVAPATTAAEPVHKEPAATDTNTPFHPTPDDAICRFLGPDQKVVRAPSTSSIPFSDLWYTAEKIAYIRDKSTSFALIPFVSDDLEDFYDVLEQGYTGHSSYAVRFAGESYRVERIMTLAGVQYNCRKMPGTVPDIHSLGLPEHIVNYLLTLSHESGLILFGGPTGMGKTTSASALMKKYLEMDGGFMYTIEDPPEMPLEGLYHAQKGGLGLCKQCPVENERWGDGIKSALRSRPRYILVGEIRTPETASQVLRAATSGHLVLSTIHASTVEDALESLIKYASGAGLTESLAADLLARGILAVIHQKLEGSEILRPVLTTAFANPHLSGGDQMRSLIRNNTINLQTLIEAQASRLFQGRSLFGNDEE